RAARRSPVDDHTTHCHGASRAIHDHTADNHAIVCRAGPARDFRTAHDRTIVCRAARVVPARTIGNHTAHDRTVHRPDPHHHAPPPRPPPPRRRRPCRHPRRHHPTSPQPL